MAEDLAWPPEEIAEWTMQAVRRERRIRSMIARRAKMLHEPYSHIDMIDIDVIDHRPPQKLLRIVRQDSKVRVFVGEHELFLLHFKEHYGRNEHTVTLTIPVSQVEWLGP